ncbi:UDP-N-acetylmuramoyl-L-alanyl-D-glutamate--2,6-diaminopimelate ligase [Metabacillus herbersteinensis]|uniref:UDP-N-acetylmuramyl-tripeptide synthetase n=1 Tax=Metabacillus herbersteinensis TaxID=283816 RepID=A0ABV6GCA2_9BACI
MKLRNLLQDNVHSLDIQGEIENIEVKGIANNSKDVEAGFIFVAIKGSLADGHQFINDAVSSGAAVIVGEETIANLSVPYLKVDDSREWLGRLASHFYDHPSERKVIVGITGTNGKTTTSYFLKHLLQENGISCSLIGTIQTIINGKATPSTNTTPSSLDLHKLISQSQDEVIIVEVSSHGLDQKRLEGIQFDLCLFTNLDHDHLDYHGTLEEYFQTKSTLFTMLKQNGLAVINDDDYWGSKLISNLKRMGQEVQSIGKSSTSTIQFTELSMDATPIFQFLDNKTQYKVQLSIPGLHNIYNCLLAFIAAKNLGVSEEKLLSSLTTFKGIEGRFERIQLINDVTVVVDYAHTASAVGHCLRTARQCKAKRIIHLFGYRGDRDEAKREEMLRISSELSDFYILTMDDLNTESSEEMIRKLQMLKKDTGKDNGCFIPDRTLAIKEAIAMSQKGDWVVITGKGHESYQQSFYLPTNSDRETIDYFDENLKEKISNW